MHKKFTLRAIDELAGKLGLDVSRLKHDMESSEVQSILARNRELGINLGVNATPTFVVGSELVSEAVDAATFEQILAQAKRRGAPRAEINFRNE